MFLYVHVYHADRVTRMTDKQLSKKVFHGENLRKENALNGGQKKSYKDTLKASLKDSPGNRLHRSEQSGVASSEKEQIVCEAERKHKVRKTRVVILGLS